MNHVDNRLGKPTLHLDGQPVPPILYCLSDFPAATSCSAQAQRNIRNFHEAGVDLVSIDAKLHVGWHKTTPFDPAHVLAEMTNALEANPGAKLLMRLHVNPPYWWMRDNPEECTVYRTEDGDAFGIDDGDYERLIYHDADRHMRVSLCSEKWLHDASEKLAILCKAIAASPECKSLIAIQPACGMFGEWHQWATDVSESMVKCFRKRLRAKYGTDEALQKAWNHPDVTIDTAPFHPETFRPADDGIFRDPQKSRFVMDAQECMQSASPSAILHFAKVLKENLPGILVGAFYGYYLGTGGNNMTIGGHLQVERLFQSDGLIDFMCGPFCYKENRQPEAVPMQRALLESLRLRGMLWLTEMDQNPETKDLTGNADPDKMDISIAMLRRNTLQPLVAGQGFWYYDHRLVPGVTKNGTAGSIYVKHGWWDHPDLMAEVEKLQKLAWDITTRPYKPAADVLLVYDKASYYVRAKVEDYEYEIHEAVARSGVVFDCIYADELEVADLSRYRCVVMVNTFMITPENRAKYRELLKDTTTVWFGPAGYCDGDTLGAANTAATVQGDIHLQQLPPTRAFMEPILRESGAHIYCEDGDPILAGAGIVAINCPAGGQRTITLRNGKQVELTLAPYTTAVLDAETGEILL